MRFFIVISFLAIFISAYGKSDSRQNVEVIYGKWTVFEMMSKPLNPADPRIPVFQIENETFRGMDGCNSFAGRWKTVDGLLEFDMGVSTQMACIPMGEAENSNDFYFKEAVSRNPAFTKTSEGVYERVTDLQPEYRDWNLTKEGVLEFLKDGKVTLRANRS
jgi:heat shock protein HslJ